MSEASDLHLPASSIRYRRQGSRLLYPSPWCRVQRRRLVGRRDC